MTAKELIRASLVMLAARREHGNSAARREAEVISPLIPLTSELIVLEFQSLQRRQSAQFRRNLA